jgi:GNAT superfamily N-acetyltransferase
MGLPGNWRRQSSLDGFENVSFVVVEYDEFNRLNQAVYLSNRAAKSEDSSFGGFTIDVHDAVLILDGVDVVGYLSYCPTSDDSEMVLRQLYLSESHRRRGIGSAVVDFWWENVASEWYSDDEGEERYFIEDPNENMLKVLESLGHGSEEGDPTAYLH